MWAGRLGAGDSRQDREGRGRSGGRVSHRLPCGEPGAQEALAHSRDSLEARQVELGGRLPSRQL